MNRIATLLTALLFFSLNGCGERDLSSLANQPSLPAGWTQIPAAPGCVPTRPLAPSREMDESVREQFAVHTAALTTVASPIHSALKHETPNATSHPADWTPWHLDGMIGTFTLDVGGLFGILSADGTASVKATWQQPAPSVVLHEKKKVAATRSNRKALAFKASMTPLEMSSMLEPVIHTAVATHAVHNEIQMRKTLRRQGLEFLTLAKVLDGIPRSRGWHVDSLQVQLVLSAEGQVSAAVGVGGQVTIFFDWQKSSGPAGFGSIQDGPLFNNVEAFAQSLQVLIPEALENSQDIRDAGFALDQFQVGVALIGGFQIGVAQANGSISGKIIFKSDSTEGVGEFLAPPSALRPIGKLNAIPYAGTLENSAQRQFADQVGIASALSSDATTLVYQVPVDVFRDGMSEAVQMGSYFLDKALSADTSRWKLSQLETEFDGSVGGSFRLVTIAGQGQFTLDFDRQ